MRAHSGALGLDGSGHAGCEADQIRGEDHSQGHGWKLERDRGASGHGGLGED
jgi:hypothetical protein